MNLEEAQKWLKSLRNVAITSSDQKKAIEKILYNFIFIVVDNTCAHSFPIGSYLRFGYNGTPKSSHVDITRAFRFYDLAALKESNRLGIDPYAIDLELTYVARGCYIQVEDLEII